jgi:hypothetical protein
VTHVLAVTVTSCWCRACFASTRRPAGRPDPGGRLAELVQVAGGDGRWNAAFQQGKGETELDHYQIRRYPAWYRHVTLSMLA